MKKRYNDGGLPDYEREPDAQDKAQQEGALAEYKSKKVPEEGTGLQEETFKDAFARARRNGEKTFEFKGKSYTTEVAKPKEKSFSEKAKKAGFTSAETKGGAALMTRKMAGGGSVSASRRGDGIAQRGKTRGKIC